MNTRFKQKIFSSLALLTILLPMMMTFVNGLNVLAAENTSQETKKVIVDSQGDTRESGEKEIEIFDHPLGSGKLSYEKVTEERGTYFEWKLAVTKNGGENPYKLGFHITSDWEPIELYSLLTTPHDIYEKEDYIYNQSKITDWTQRHHISELWEADFGMEGNQQSVIRFKTKELSEIEVKAYALVQTEVAAKDQNDDKNKQVVELADNDKFQEKGQPVESESKDILTDVEEVQQAVTSTTPIYNEQLVELNGFGVEINFPEINHDDSKDDSKNDINENIGNNQVQTDLSLNNRLSIFRMGNDLPRDISTLIGKQKIIQDSSSITFKNSDGKTVITDPENGVPADAKIDIDIAWALPNSNDDGEIIFYKIGDFFEFTLPNFVKYDEKKGKLTHDTGNGILEDFGTYVIDTNGKVTLTFTKDISNMGDIEGTIKYGHSFIDKLVPGEIEVENPFSDKLPKIAIFLQPAVKNSIDKSGAFDSPANPTKINWQVDFNKDMSVLNGAVLKDFFENAQMNPIDEASIKVYELIMNSDGTVVEQEKGERKYLKAGTDYDYLAASREITLKGADYGSTRKALRVEFSTSIKDGAKLVTEAASSTTGVTFNNEVHLYPDGSNLKDPLSASASLTTLYTPDYKKSNPKYTKSDQTYEWSINYNYHGSTITGNTTIVDTLGDKQSFDQNSLALYPVTFKLVETKNSSGVVTSYKVEETIDRSNPYEEGIDYKVEFSTANNEMIITLLDKSAILTSPFKIEYKSKYDGIMSKPLGNQDFELPKIENKATTNGNTIGDISSPGESGSLIKSLDTNSVNYAKRTVDWQILVNQDAYEMRDWVLTDTLPIGLTLVESSFVIKETGSSDKAGMLKSGTDYELDHDPKSGKFTVTLKATTKKKLTITYTTNFDTSLVDKGSSTRFKFINTAKATWKDNDKGEYEDESEAFFQPVDNFQRNGTKSGTYNATNKEIRWSLRLNYNKTPLKDATVVDTIKEGQKFVEGSLKIYKMRVHPEGSSDVDEELNPTTENITIDYPSANNKQTLTIKFPDSKDGTVTGDGESYGIYFKTSLDNTIINDTKYVNTATWSNKQHGETISRVLSGNVTVKHGGTFANKSVAKSDDQLKWTVTLNPAQSTIADFKVVDKPSNNQIILEDTIQIHKTDVHENGTVTPNKEMLTRDIDYSVDLQTDLETGNQTMEILFENQVATAYVLTYASEISSLGGDDWASNSVSIHGSANVKYGKDITVKERISYASGTANGKSGSIVLKKLGRQNEELVGAELTLWILDKDGNLKTPYRKGTTEQNGTLKFGNIKPGDYKVTESKAPTGYSISKDLLQQTDSSGNEVGGVEVTVKANENGEPFVNGEEIIKNEPIKVTLTKKDGSVQETDKLLSGATYILEKLNEDTDKYELVNPQPQTLTTDATGKLVIDSGLSLGKYQLTEKIAPDGYLVDNAPIQFVIAEQKDNSGKENGVILPIEIIHKNYQGSVTLKKLDGSTSSSLAGASYVIKDSFGNTVDGGSTNPQGELYIGGLAPGEYSLIETVAPTGYVLNTEPISFEIVRSQPLREQSETQYSVVNKDGQPAISKVEANNTNPVSTISKYAQNFQGSFKARKVASDDQDEGLAGAKYSVYAANSEGKFNESAQPIALFTEKEVHSTKQATVVESDKSGNIYGRGLSVGTYFLVEVEAPTGYILDTKRHKFEITATTNKVNQSVAAVNLGNLLNYQGSVTLTKVDAKNQEPLPGAGFKLYYADGTFKDQEVSKDKIYTTSKSGILSADQLAPGKYYFKEENAPTGYVKSNEKYDFEIGVKAAGKPAVVEIQDGQPVVNKLAQGTISVTKVDEEDKDVKLAGAEFTLTNDKDAKDIQVAVTGEQGTADFTIEANTTYSLKETKAPIGYNQSDYYENGITLKKDGEELKYQVSNQRTKIDIVANKAWDLKGNDKDYLPKEIEISLIQDGNTETPYKTATVTADQDGNWSYTFPQVPKVNLKTGEDYQYTIKEAAITGYKVAKTAKVDNNKATITNILATTKLSGTKYWELSEYDSDILPESITVKLQMQIEDEDYQDFTRDGKSVTAKVTAKDNWQYEFKDLPTHTGKGEKITYRVMEEAVTGFNEDESKRGQEMTAADLTNVLETTEFTIQKNWRDQDNFYQTRPDKINFELYVKHDNKWQSFEEFFGVEKQIEVTANDQGIWTTKVSGLPKYVKGKVVQYGIKEINTGKTYQSSHADKVQAVKNDNVQVENELVTTELALTKVWDDLSNQYNTRPTAIKVQLLSYVGKDADAAKAMGTKSQPDGIFELSGKKDQWQLAVNDLPKYNATGQKINYLFKEAEAIPGYQATKVVKVDQEGSATITNQLATTEVSGTKHWELSGYSDKILPETITVKLQMQNAEGKFADFIRNGKVLKAKVTAKDQWAYQFENLPSHNGQGQEIKYRVVEEAVPGYREDDAKRGETKQAADLTNVLELTEFTLKKTWDDQENFHNTRPDKITFELYVKQENKWQSFEEFFGVKKVITVSPDKEGNWETKVAGLPKFVKGEEVQYGIKEVAEIETYQSSLLSKVQPVKNQKITVKNSLSTISLTLTKVWNDFGNYFSTRPESIKVQLFSYVGQDAKTAKAHGVKGNKDGIYELSDTDGKWRLTVNDLAKYTAKGEKIQYFFREISENAAYHDPEDALVNDQGKATLTNNMLKRDIDGQIHWDLGDFDEEVLPEDVVVKLQSKTENDDEYTDVTKDGEPQKVVVNEKDDWRYEFPDVPTHTGDGEKIVYRVIEDDVPGFTEVESEEPTDIIDVIELTEFTLKKNWDDQDDFFNTRPEKINFELFVKQDSEWKSFADVFGVDKEIELTANEKDVWETKITGLPKYAKSKVIQYGLKEITESKIYQSNFIEDIQAIRQPEITVTNKLVTTDLTLTKIWADLSNQFNTRPEAIELQLMSYAGEDVATAKAVATKDQNQGIFKLSGKDDQWTLNITDLPKYDATGQTLTYLVQEVKSPVGYTAHHEGLTVTNALNETTVSGEKIWEDNNDKLGLRPESITIVLNQNGQEFMTTEVSGKDNWQYQFMNLPKVDEQGEAYNYSISEKEVENYTTRIVDYNVVNTIKERAQLPQTQRNNKTTPTGLSSTIRSLLPQTGTEIAGTIMMTVIGFGLLVAVVLIYRKRKGE